MTGPLRVDGLVSGIDFTSIIQQLLQAQRRPVTSLQAQIAGATLEKNALLEVNLSLLSLKSSADALARPSFYNGTVVGSSNEDVLGVSGGSTGALGSFNFTVSRLAQAHQLISNGVADRDTTALTGTATTLTIEQNGGFLERATEVEFLNGEAGIDRGAIRVTDTAGNSGVIDLSSVLTVKDALDRINESTQVSVEAAVSGNRITVKDTAGGAGTLKIENIGLDSTATSLGIAKSGVTVGSNQFVFGNDILSLGSSASLSVLNDGLGVRRNADGTGDFTIRDGQNVSFTVDIASTDKTVGDVITAINTAATNALSTLQASLSNDGNSIILQSTAGATSIQVTQASDSFAAADLGFGVLSGAAFVQNVAEDSANGREDAATGNRLVGRSLVPGLNSTLRDLLNGGQTNLTAGERKGVSDGTVTITDRAGSSVTLNLSQRVFTQVDGNASIGATSIQVDNVGGLQLAGFAVGNRVRFQNSSNEVEYRTITAIDTATRQISFDEALTIQVNNNDGIYAQNDSVEDILRNLNSRAADAGVNVKFELNLETNGLRVIDTSGGTGTLSVSGTPADDLGISGSVSADFINGADLDVQYLGEQTALSDLNGGGGVSVGRFRVTDTQGILFNVDLTQADDTTLGDVVGEVNSEAGLVGSGVRARINDTGDGILIEDTTPGAGTLRVEELDNGTTASDLNIAGAAPSATPAALDGSFETKVDIEANSTLQDVADAINAASLGVTAAIVNDGSSSSPFRLTLTSQRTGRTGRLVIDARNVGLTFSTTNEAQDAVLLSGAGSAGGDPAVIRSSKNTIEGVVPGLTLELKSVSSSPVSVTVDRDNGSIADQAERLVESYNEVVSTIRNFTGFNPDTFETGALFGNSAVLRIRRDLANAFVRPVDDIPTSEINTLAEVGIRAGAEGTLTFDKGKFSGLLDSDFDAVQKLFILQRPLELDTPIADLNSGLGITDTAGDDFEITVGTGAKFQVDIAGATSLSSLLSAINSAPGNTGLVTASISSDGFSLQFVDTSGGSTNAFSIKDLDGATAAAELKIKQTLEIGETILKGGIIGLKGDPGAATRLSSILDSLTRAGDGLISVKTDGLDEKVTGLEESIEKIEAKLESEQERLIRQFTNLELIIAQAQSDSQRLSVLFNSLVSGGGFF